MGEDVCAFIITDVESQLPLCIVDVGSGGVVHAVMLMGAALLLLVDDVKFFRGLFYRAFVAIQTEEAGIEGREICFQDFRSVALGIDGNKQHLHTRCIGAQHVHRRRKISHGRRAGIRTVSVAEKYCDDLPFEVGKGSDLPVVISEVEIFAEIGAGNVRRKKRGLFRLATC